MKRRVLLILITVAVAVAGCYRRKELYDPKYNDAHMAKAIDRALESSRDVNISRKEELNKIVKQYIPVGTPREKALEVLDKNSFICVRDLGEQESYFCSMKDVLGGFLGAHHVIDIFLYIEDRKVSEAEIRHAVTGMP